MWSIVATLSCTAVDSLCRGPILFHPVGKYSYFHVFRPAPCFRVDRAPSALTAPSRHTRHYTSSRSDLRRTRKNVLKSILITSRRRRGGETSETLRLTRWENESVSAAHRCPLREASNSKVFASGRHLPPPRGQRPTTETRGLAGSDAISKKEKKKIEKRKTLTFFGGGDQVVRVHLRKTIRRRWVVVGRRHERYGRGRRGPVAAAAAGALAAPREADAALPVSRIRRGRVAGDHVTGRLRRRRRRRHDEYDYHSKDPPPGRPGRSDAPVAFAGDIATTTRAVVAGSGRRDQTRSDWGGGKSRGTRAPGAPTTEDVRTLSGPELRLAGRTRSGFRVKRTSQSIVITVFGRERRVRRPRTADRLKRARGRRRRRPGAIASSAAPLAGLPRPGARAGRIRPTGRRRRRRRARTSTFYVSRRRRRALIHFSSRRRHGRTVLFLFFLKFFSRFPAIVFAVFFPFSVAFFFYYYFFFYLAPPAPEKRRARARRRKGKARSAVYGLWSNV